jgi:hypothetical protein
LYRVNQWGCRVVWWRVNNSRHSDRFRKWSEQGDLAQMVERSLSMREALGSMPRFSIVVIGEFDFGALWAFAVSVSVSAHSVVVTYKLPMLVPRVRFPVCAFFCSSDDFSQSGRTRKADVTGTNRESQHSCTRKPLRPGLAGVDCTRTGSLLKLFPIFVHFSFDKFSKVR